MSNPHSNSNFNPQPPPFYIPNYGYPADPQQYHYMMMSHTPGYPPPPATIPVNLVDDEEDQESVYSSTLEEDDQNTFLDYENLSPSDKSMLTNYMIELRIKQRKAINLLNHCEKEKFKIHHRKFRKNYNTYLRKFNNRIEKKRSPYFIIKSFTDSKGQNITKIHQKDTPKSLWNNICHRDLSKAFRAYNQYQINKSSNLRKVALICQREIKRANIRGWKFSKDLQNRSRRATREMLLFWKRNEREERELRKKAEKEALEKLKKEEEMREAKRQARKLNFLITQTELYSHFIGNKSNNNELDLNQNVDFKSIDFDNEDDQQLKQKAMISAQKALAAQKAKTREFDNDAKNTTLDESTVDQMDFLNPSSMSNQSIVEQPKMLNCKMKSYQLKGLNWLANMYEQGINGILADEMGLGKTVQSISLLTHLAENHNIWGPFLVVSPASTLHNWIQEIEKFVPEFKPLPYWGSINDRKTLRKFWNRKLLGTKDAPFHVLITSYQLVVTDEKYFQRMKWQYMILDEAQAIKSSSSQRWKILLKFNCRNRLLLTGTPIQNSMFELWSLLHFIMPTLFDSHEEFSEWFSKDIESHAQEKGKLNEHQLKRLHLILKPFMLRRIKKDVENELGDKVEKEVKCFLTIRQRKMYHALKSKLSISELLDKMTSLGDNDGGVDSLMNLVMQFRKVCNHPELFERADVESPVYCILPQKMDFIFNQNYETFIPNNPNSFIQYKIPKLIFRNIIQDLSINNYNNYSLNHLFNIWNPIYINENQNVDKSIFSIMKFVDYNPNELIDIFRGNLLYRMIMELDRSKKLMGKNSKDYKFLLCKEPLHELIIDKFCQIENDYKDFGILKTLGNSFMKKVIASPANFLCEDASFKSFYNDLYYNRFIRSILFNIPNQISFREKYQVYPRSTYLLNNLTEYEKSKLIPKADVKQGFTNIWVPSVEKFILDSGKMLILDKLLPQLKSEGHRILIFFQMTKMIDLMEEYLIYRQHSYLRLDGSTTISERRDMVNDWQTRPELFIFLLSTRAGGLGINLTAADTVIFYDSDWNPTVDQQAMDRAHRLGQTKQVTVYRLVTAGTIEEKILIRAKQKDQIQKVVISGGEFQQQVDFKKKEIVSLLLDDEEMATKLEEQQKKIEEQKKAKSEKASASMKKRSKEKKENKKKNENKEPAKKKKKKESDNNNNQSLDEIDELVEMNMDE